MLGAVVHAVDEMRQGRNPIDDGGVVSLFASPEQRESLAKVQALMSLLEGHGNAVMNRLGADLVDGQARMARVLSARRNARGATALLHKLMGLELKMKQYEQGEAFVNAIEREAGLHAVDPAWQSPDLLPTVEELDAPLTWLARVDGATVPTR
jgi:putative hydrolase